jgi:hypothetical protein
MKFAAISLEGVAAVLGVFVSASGVYVAAREFKRYRSKQRSEGAVKASAILNNFVNYIKQILEKQNLYEIPGYYPDRIPEVTLNDNERCNARPFRLIFNEFNKFKKEFGEATVKIGEEESRSLNKLLDKIEQLISDLSNFLPQEAGDKEFHKQMLLEKIQKSQLWCEEIDKIQQEAQDILRFIINGGK